jgi:hypothetical protein
VERSISTLSADIALLILQAKSLSSPKDVEAICRYRAVCVCKLKEMERGCILKEKAKGEKVGPRGKGCMQRAEARLSFQ